MNVFLKLAFVCLVFSVIVSVLFIISSIQPIPVTGEFILLTNRVIVAVFISFILLLLVFYFAKKGEKKIKIPMKELERIVYKIDEVDKSKLSEKGKAKKLVKSVLPYIDEILKEYKEFVYSLPYDYQRVLRTVHTSLKGKHGHYAEERLVKDSKHLKEMFLEIMRKYKV